MDFCPALDMANMCIQLQATLREPDRIDWPAWVQAVGSIAAIWYAGKLARDQLGNEIILRRQEKLAADDSLHLGVRAITDSCEAAVFSALNALRNSTFGAVTLGASRVASITREAHRGLTDAPLHAFGCVEMTYAVMSLKLTLQETLEYLEKCSGPGVNGAFIVMINPDFFEDVDLTIVRAEKVFGDIRRLTQPAFDRAHINSSLS